MTVQLKIEPKETADLPAHYEQLAYDTLRVLWHRKLLISAILVAAVLLVSVMLVLIGPCYSSEAIIELNFIREVPTAGAQIQPTASVDAAAIVDSAARVIRSQAIASAVVARLRLDKDPAATHAVGRPRPDHETQRRFLLGAVQEIPRGRIAFHQHLHEQHQRLAPRHAGAVDPRRHRQRGTQRHQPVPAARRLPGVHARRAQTLQCIHPQCR